jgi:hypothetical protein
MFLQMDRVKIGWVIFKKTPNNVKLQTVPAARHPPRSQAFFI